MELMISLLMMLCKKCNMDCEIKLLNCEKNVIGCWF